MTNHFCQDISIPCTAGNLEGRMWYREENRDRPGVILCPPHPLLAGNMDNNVIQDLADTLANHFTILSFNYRNVGKSFKPEGDLPLFEYWDRLDQLNDFSVIIQDIRDILNWSKRFFTTFHLVGYSFGSYIGLSSLSETALSYCGITPPLSEHPFDFTQIQSPAMLIFAEQDGLLRQNTMCLPQNIETHEVKGTDHFFRNHETEVCAIVKDFLVQEIEY